MVFYRKYRPQTIGELDSPKLRETLTKVYVQRTRKPLWIISEDMERDVFMSATEAQAYGIVDLVGVDIDPWI